MVQKCPLCNSKSVKLLFKSINKHGRHPINRNDQFDLLRCSYCRVIFVGSLTVDKNYYRKYYQDGYYDGVIANGTSKGVMNQLVNKLETWSLKQKRHLLLSNVPKSLKRVSVLDVGCGNGRFLSGLDPDVFERNGIEINQEGYKECIKKKLNVFNKDILDIKFKNKKFDIITLWHVVEHLRNPTEVFKKIRTLLKKDGVLIFSTPNTDCLGFKFGRQNWFHLDSPRHLILFNPASMNYLSRNTGFHIRNSIYEWYDFPLDLFWSLISTPLRLLVYPLYPIYKYLDREALTVVLTPQ